MGCRMDLFELPDRDLRVDLRAPDVGVSQHLLDETEVGSVSAHQDRHDVVEQPYCDAR